MKLRPPRRSSARAAIPLAAFGACLLLLWAWLGRPHVAPAARPAPQVVATPASVEPQTQVVAAAVAPPPAAPPAAPIVDEVLVEKRSVCEGEDNLVTVRAHTPDGSDGFLHYTIAGTAGSPNPVRLYRQKDGSVPWPSIRVFGKNNVVTSVPVPRYDVRDCGPTRTVLVTHALMPNTSSDFDFSARVVQHGEAARGAPLQVVEYTWRFGDGSTATTKAPHVSHSYEKRPQTTLSSDFVVEVEARSVDGARVSGRATLDLRNPAFEMRSVGHVVAIMASLDPRFPELGPDGVVNQRVRLWHADARSVILDRVRATKSYADGRASRPEEVDVGAALGSTRIPPGPDGIVSASRLDTNADPDVLMVTYEIEGTSSDGLIAKGSFSVMRPPVPSKEPITDKAMLAKIAAAQGILHKDVVTMRDLGQLEQEGAFASLEPKERR